MRVVVEPRRRRRDPDLVEQIDRAVAGIGLGQLEVVAHALDELAADRVHRVERGHRVLEHEPDVPAAVAQQLLLVQGDQVGAHQRGRTGDPAGRHRDQFGQRQGRHALARPGLADDRQRLTTVQVVVEAANHVGEPALGAEHHLEVADGEHRFPRAVDVGRAAVVGGRHHHCPRDWITDRCLGSSASRRPSPTRLNAITVMKIARPGNTLSHHP